MRRRTFDVLMVLAGLGVAVVLAVAGVLLTWGHAVVADQVHSQLAAQKIYVPAVSNPGFKELPKADQNAMRPYAGQLMTNGAQAKAYADHYIAVHLKGIGGGKTYSQLSEAAMAQPNNTKLADLVQVMFRGTTLRSMLLEAYGFWQIGQIAWIAAIVSYVAAGLLLVLSAFGLVHLRRVPESAEVFSKVAQGVKVQTA